MPLSAKELREEFLSELTTPLIAEKLFADVPDIVFCVKNTQRQYISANKAFAERLGVHSVNSILGKTAADIFPEHLASTYEAQDNYVLEKEKEINDRLELVSNRNGTLGWYLARKIPLFEKEGKIIGLASISRDLLTASDADLRFTGLIQVIETIQKHFSENLKPSDLAKKANLSKTQLERRMKKIFKLSTSQFIRKTRIEAAAKMLINSSKPIIEIALDCGYSDQSSFSRLFKSTVGLPPRTYRSVYQKT